MSQVCLCLQQELRRYLRDLRVEPVKSLGSHFSNSRVVLLAFRLTYGVAHPPAFIIVGLADGMISS